MTNDISDPAWVAVEYRDAVETYVSSAAVFRGEDLPAGFDGPLRVRRAPVVVVAETAA